MNLTEVLLSKGFKLSRTKENLWFLKCSLDGDDLLLYVDLRGPNILVYAYFCDGNRTRLQDVAVNSLPLVKEIRSIYSIGLPPVPPNNNITPKKKKGTTKKKCTTPKTLYDYEDKT